MTFVTITNTTTTFYNFNYFLCLWFFLFLFTYNISITIVSTSNAQCFCHIMKKIIFGRSTRFIINLFFFLGLKVYIWCLYLYSHHFGFKKTLGLVICSGEIVSLINISPNISSTLNCVFFKKFFPLIKVVTLNLFQFLSFFLISIFIYHWLFQSLSKSSVITIIQSLRLVYRISNFEINSLMIKIAIDVKRAVEEVYTITLLGLIFDIVDYLNQSHIQSIFQL